MRRTITFISAMICLLLLNSCNLFEGWGANNLDKVQKGMTRKEVIKILGNPRTRSFEGDTEDIAYKILQHINPDLISFTHIYLKNDTVVGMKTEMRPFPPQQNVIVKEKSK
ncbi:MAG: outer membrane protein assembly factor BamE [Bacteroidaceae bacterium]|nr:outer membrane protein assembly factor BamE [Bacteroidaceae bacterium]